MKKCAHCKEIKEFNYFYKSRNSKDGLRWICKECSKIESSIWAKNNLQKVQMYQKKWIQAHRENMNKNTEEWRLRNTLKLAISRKKWKTLNPIRYRQSKNKYRNFSPLLIIKIIDTICGVCLEPLEDKNYPDLRSTSIGHEPPLSRAAKEGWQVICERPEHLGCNLSKNSKMDYELKGVVDFVLPTYRIK